MKKFIAFLLSLILLLGITACNQAKFKVKIADNYEIVNELKTKYSAGEEVTIQLETITEHYYVLSVNGVQQEPDRDSSDMMFTYFTFTMPDEDVLIEIEDRWVDIPYPSQQTETMPTDTAGSGATAPDIAIAYCYVVHTAQDGFVVHINDLGYVFVKHADSEIKTFHTVVIEYDVADMTKTDGSYIDIDGSSQSYSYILQKTRGIRLADPSKGEPLFG